MPATTEAAPQRPTVLQLGKYYAPFKGGIESHLQSLCESLVSRCEVEVIAANTEPKTSRERFRGVPVTRMASGGTALSTPLTPGMVSWMMFHNGHDIIHMHLPNPFATVAYLAAKPHGRLVVSYHSDIVRQRNLRGAYELLQRRLLSHADVILVSSPNYLESSETLQPHLDRCKIIPYGINPGRYQDTPEQLKQERDVRQRYGDRLVLGVGRHVAYKGFDVLLRAMQRIDGTLLLVGSGPMEQTLRSLAAQLGVADRVQFLGEIKTNELTACYRACDVFVLPSIARNESFGIVQLEAMAAGKPVVSTALKSGVPFVNKDGTSGLVVPPGDDQALAAAVSHLLDDPVLARRLGEGARKRVAHEFDNELMVDRVWDVYLEATNGRN